jgi:MoaA/NifB/PqqE/SkfB family radical SAM enzyme
MLSITHAQSLGVRVQINTVINHYSQNHLDITVKFLTKQFPKLQHFVWNNLDPLMMRKTETAMSTLPDYDAVEMPLRRAMEHLSSTDRTFRVERLPLCYMRGFEHFSTETRKLVKDEERMVHFLDQRDIVHQRTHEFRHDYAPECQTCDLYDICAGIWMHDPTDIASPHGISPGYYDYVKYKPQKLTPVEKQKIIDTILSTQD